MDPLKRVKETATAAADQMRQAAADTRAAILTLAAVALGALAVALWALLSSRKAVA